MKKLRFLSILFCLTILTVLFTGMTAAASERGTCGDGVSYLIDGDGILTITGKGAIEDKAFFGRNDIKTIHIGEGVTAIGASAFCGCEKLGEIRIPESLTMLGEFCFAQCGSVETVTIPAGVRELPNDCFLGSRIKSIKLSSRLVKIGDRAISKCTELTNMSVPTNVSYIGSNAFSGCTKLESLICEAEVPPELGENVFSGLDKLTKIGVSCFGIDSYKTAAQWNDFELYAYSEPCGEDAVAVLDHEGNMVISGGGDIADRAFCERGDIKAVLIANGITSIGAYAFCGCENLTTIEIPESVEAIGESCFAECGALSRVALPTGIRELPDCCFMGSRITAVKLPEKLERIGASAFDGCTSIDSIRIPAGVKYIGEHAFNNCQVLSAVICEAETPPELGESAFETGKMLESIGVPSGCDKKYRAAEQWKQFNIVPFVDGAAAADIGGNVWTMLGLLAAAVACIAVFAYFLKKKGVEKQ